MKTDDKIKLKEKKIALLVEHRFQYFWLNYFDINKEQDHERN